MLPIALKHNRLWPWKSMAEGAAEMQQPAAKAPKVDVTMDVDKKEETAQGQRAGEGASTPEG
eukprot:8339434-Prorocentrum_lima.AAC.1